MWKCFSLQTGNVSCTFVSYSAHFLVGTEPLCVTTMIPSVLCPSPLGAVLWFASLQCRHTEHRSLMDLCLSVGYPWRLCWDLSSARLCKRLGNDRADKERALKQVCSCVPVISCSSDCQILQFAKIKHKYLQKIRAGPHSRIPVFLKEEDLGCLG